MYGKVRYGRFSSDSAHKTLHSCMHIREFLQLSSATELFSLPNLEYLPDRDVTCLFDK